MSKKAGTYLLVLPWEPYHVGGVNVVAKNLLKQIEYLEWLNPKMAVNDWEHRLPKYKNHVIYFRFSLISNDNPMAVLKSTLLAPWVLLQTFILLKKHNVQVVNYHYPGTIPFGIALLKRLGIFKGKLLLSFHGTDVYATTGKIEKLIQRFILTAADNLVACSNGLAERAASTFSIPRKIISVIYNGVDTSVFRPDTDTNGAIRSKFFLPRYYIISVGSMIHRKAHDLLLDAFLRITPAYPDISLFIVGADGSERETIQNKIKKFELGNHVRIFMALPQHEVAFLLANAILCVQPAIAESFPLALLEAGATGTPILASRISGHDEIIEDNINGRMFTVGNSKECAKIIIEMLNNPIVTKKMADRLREKILKDFSWETCAKGYQALCN